MFDFIKRFVLAWRLARNPDALKILWTEVKARENELQVRQNAGRMARVAVPTLVPADRHDGRKALDVTVYIEAREIAAEEVQRVLEESRIDNKPKLPLNPFVTKLGNEAALEKHNEKVFDQLVATNRKQCKTDVALRELEQ